jgi:hypothetical protein
MTGPANQVEFLAALYPSGSVVSLATIDPQGGSPVCICVKIGAENWEKRVEEWNRNARRQRQNQYFTVCTLRAPKGKKIEKADISQIVILHVDADPVHGILFDEAQAKLDKLCSTGWPADVPRDAIVVNSGGGRGLFWKVPLQTVNGDIKLIEEIERRTKWLHDQFKATGLCHIDGTQNADRLMRMPWTENYPNKKKEEANPGRGLCPTSLLEYSATVHELAVFPQADPGAAQAESGEQPEDNAGPDPADNAALDDDEISELVAILKPQLIERMINGPKNADRLSSWSETQFSISCALAHSGIGPQLQFRAHLTPHFKWLNLAITHTNCGTKKRRASFVKYALDQVTGAIAKVGSKRQSTHGFILNPFGKPNGTATKNVNLALKLLGVTVRHDVFADRSIIEGLEGCGPLLDDAAGARLWVLINEKFGLVTSWEFFLRVVQDQAYRNPFHPVQEYLESLKWDGIPRIDTWLTTYAGVKNTPLTRAWGSLWLRAGVRRIYEPGIKFDEILVFESSQQGKEKSTAFQILAVKPEWFSDSVLLGAKGREMIEALNGKWIIECSDLHGMSDAKIDILKAQLSRQVDRGRGAYGHFQGERPRQNVFGGTTNSSQYLKDSTGNRRFWCVVIAGWYTQALRADRDQLWAEAYARRHESIRLDPKLYAAAAAEQEARAIVHPWVDRLAETFQNMQGRVRILDIWARVLKIEDRNQRTENARHLGESMKVLGWNFKQGRYNGGNPEGVYWRGDEGRKIIFSEEMKTYGSGESAYQQPTGNYHPHYEDEPIPF